MCICYASAINPLIAVAVGMLFVQMRSVENIPRPMVEIFMKDKKFLIPKKNFYNCTVVHRL
jgi:hypothetical protein